MASKAASPLRKKAKKEVRHSITTKLETLMSDLKEGLGEKKFKRNVKKAGKILLTGYSKKVATTVPKVKKVAAPKAEKV